MSKLKSLRESVSRIALPCSGADVVRSRPVSKRAELRRELGEAYEQVLSLEPGRVEAKLKDRLRLLQLTGHISEAIVRTEALVQADPKLAEGWLLLSRLELADGDRRSASEHYQKALQLRPALKDNALEKLVEGLLLDHHAGANHWGRGEGRWSADEDGDDADGDRFSPEGFMDELSKPAISLVSMSGMEDVKEEIRMKIIYPLQNRDLFDAYGRWRGVLLYGPPGCGKTLISQATAGEIRSNFISVALHQILDLYIGNSEKNLHQLFQLARDHAPTILFFDEVDALAADRKDLRESGMRTLINQFLAEMDGNVMIMREF